MLEQALRLMFANMSRQDRASAAEILRRACRMLHVAAALCEEGAATATATAADETVISEALLERLRKGQVKVVKIGLD